MRRAACCWSRPVSDRLHIQDLRVRYRILSDLAAALTRSRVTHVDAVLGVSLAIPAGSSFGLVGESGSGKSTLARCIVGLVRPDAGRIVFDGRAIEGLGEGQMKPVRREMALMFQDPQASLSPRLTVRSLVTEPFRIHAVAGIDTEAEAIRLLDMVGLTRAHLGRYPHELSGGQARRVGIARALALSPKLVIADEPTAGLDVSVQGEVLNLMKRLRRELGLTYLIITHNLPMIRHASDRLAVMYLGRVVEQGPTRAVFARPAHPYSRGLLAAIPQPDPDRRRTDVQLRGEIPSLRDRPTGCEFHTRCPIAQARCRVEAPVAATIGADHQALCHYPMA
jgi:peptide/nickel transport system ATP-binding protein